MSELELAPPRAWHSELLRETLAAAIPEGLTRWQVWLAFRDKGAGALDTIAAIEQAKRAGWIREGSGWLRLTQPPCGVCSDEPRQFGGV